MERTRFRKLVDFVLGVKWTLVGKFTWVFVYTRTSGEKSEHWVDYLCWESNKGDRFVEPVIDVTFSGKLDPYRTQAYLEEALPWFLGVTSIDSSRYRYGEHSTNASANSAPVAGGNVLTFPGPQETVTTPVTGRPGKVTTPVTLSFYPRKK